MLLCAIISALNGSTAGSKPCDEHGRAGKPRIGRALRLRRTTPEGTPSGEFQESNMNFQDVILTLQDFWAKQGCAVVQPMDIECGAGTFNPSTFLRVIGPEPWLKRRETPCWVSASLPAAHAIAVKHHNTMRWVSLPLDS